MYGSMIGKWVEISLADGKTWVGKLEESDEDALFISNGHEYGHQNHKGAECTNDEAKEVKTTDQRVFSVK